MEALAGEAAEDFRANAPKKYKTLLDSFNRCGGFVASKTAFPPSPSVQLRATSFLCADEDAGAIAEILILHRTKLRLSF